MARVKYGIFDTEKDAEDHMIQKGFKTAKVEPHKRQDQYRGAVPCFLMTLDSKEMPPEIKPCA